MKSSEVIQTLKSTIEATKKADIENISLQTLEAYVNKLEEASKETPEGVAAGEAAMESYKANLNHWALSRQQEHEFDLEMLRAVIATGQSALKSAVLINGGASVAMLAFVGNIWQTKNEHMVTFVYLSSSLLNFVIGVLLSAIASGTTYISQAGYADEFGKHSQKIGKAAHLLTVLAIIASYIFFGYGAWLAYASMVSE